MVYVPIGLFAQPKYRSKAGIIELAGTGLLEAVADAIAKHGQPSISNTDQGRQFTSAAFTGLLLESRVQISMDERGAWRDDVFVERLWRSVRYEEIYLHACGSVAEARAGLGRYLTFL